MLRYVDEDGVVLDRASVRAGVGKGRIRVQVVEFEDSIVDESARHDADLNVLVKRWMAGEAVPQFKPLEFGDVSDVGSFQEMRERLLQVEDAFRKLPLEIREHFRNSPALFADAFADPEQLSFLEEAGVVERIGEAPEEPAPPPAPPIVPAPVPVPPAGTA